MKPMLYDVEGILKAGSVFQEAMGSRREQELADYKLAQEQKRYDEERAWKLEDRDRAAKERKAADLFYSEFGKGVQTKGGIYGDALAAEANKYALTDDEIGLATQFKNDPSLARAAGHNALADKLAWQIKVSDKVDPFLQSGAGEETRVEMYDRIGKKIADSGLPVPKEFIVAADQARLAEKTAEEAELKRLKEAKADILKSDQANAWKYINTLGNTSTGIDSNGNEIQIQTGPSASVQNRSNTSFNNDVDKGLTDILKTIEDKTKGAESTSKAVASDQAINLYTTLVRDQGISPDVASKLVSNGVGSEEAGWKSLWLGDPKAKLTKDQLNTILPSAMAAMELKKDLVGGTTSVSGKGTGKQEAAADLVGLLGAQSKAQLSSIIDEQSKLARGAEGRRDDKVNAWLQAQGLTAVPKATVETSGTTAPGKGDTRADRNNNPGNLTGDDKWQGMVGKDGRFIQFQSYELGSRALAKNLMNGAVGKTVEDYMNKYAPKSENDTNAYIKNVSKALGKEPGSVITDKDVLPLMKVIAKQEGGKVDEKGLEAGYKLATVFNGNGTEVATVKDNEPIKSIKELFGESEVVSNYLDKKEKQDKELSSSAYARTFGPTTEEGKYAKVWKESDSKKGSSLSKNIASLSAAMSKDGISTYEDVANLYKSMPKGPDKDAVGEVLNYKGMQNSQEWRDKKAKEQYLEAGLTALSAIPGGGKVAKEIIAQPIKNAIRDRAEAAAVKKVVETPLALPNFATGTTPWVNKNAVVTTDKLNGVNLERALEKSVPDTALINSLNSANTAKRELATTVPSNTANLNYFRLTGELNKFKNETDAKMLWNGALEAQKNGQITKEHLMQIMREINDKGLISTRKLMEDLPK